MLSILSCCFLLCFFQSNVDCVPIYGLFLNAPAFQKEGVTFSSTFEILIGSGTCQIKLETSTPGQFSSRVGFDEPFTTSSKSISVVKTDDSINGGSVEATLKVECTSSASEVTTMTRKLTFLDDEDTAKKTPCEYTFTFKPNIKSGDNYFFEIEVLNGDCKIKLSSQSESIAEELTATGSFSITSRNAATQETILFDIESIDLNYPSRIQAKQVSVTLYPTGLNVYISFKYYAYADRINLYINNLYYATLNSKLTVEESGYRIIPVSNNLKDIPSDGSQYFLVLDSQDKPPTTFSLNLESALYSNRVYYTFKIIKNSAIAEGDPHFSQYISDWKTKHKRRICYDVSGKSEQKIVIFTVQNRKIQILGKLLDDYYMHSIEIKTPNGSLTIDTNGLYYKNKLLSLWVERRERFLLNNLQIDCNKNYIVVKYLRKNSFTAYVLRSRNNFNKTYININIKADETNVASTGGLIGDIAKKKFQFLQNVQNNSQSFILMDGLLTRGIVKKATAFENCLFLNVGDLIFPETIDKYVF